MDGARQEVELVSGRNILPKLVLKEKKFNVFKYKNNIIMDELLQYIPGDLICFKGKRAKVEFNNPKCDSICIRVIEYEEENRIWNVLEKEISPISLTSEILEDNGWKKDEAISFETQLYYKKKFGNKIIFVIVGENDLRVVYDNSCLRIIQYTHELQHILFGLGFSSRMEIY